MLPPLKGRFQLRSLKGHRNNNCLMFPPLVATGVLNHVLPWRWKPETSSEAVMSSTEIEILGAPLQKFHRDCGADSSGLTGKERRRRWSETLPRSSEEGRKLGTEPSGSAAYAEPMSALPKSSVQMVPKKVYLPVSPATPPGGETGEDR
ncbi:UNVERIFIED_CONTAM: hypothetical protein FKN15_004421 [Acipenser sinensis]